MGSLRHLLAAAVILAATLPLAASAQRGRSFRGGGGLEASNPAYNGKFTFTRIRYNRGVFFSSNAWEHDYPQADMHLPLILDAITALKPNLNQSNILDLEDPEIFRNPILYMWEPGYWAITDEGAENLRRFMDKGGFIIFDDFESYNNQWANFATQFRRAMPGAEFVRLDVTHPLFHSFFDFKEINVPHPSASVVPEFYAVYKDNDPSKRMMALINFNSDIAEYWELSATGRLPVDTTNDAYKLGINYMIYAFLH